MEEELKVSKPCYQRDGAMYELKYYSIIIDVMFTLIVLKADCVIFVLCIFYVSP